METTRNTKPQRKIRVAPFSEFGQASPTTQPVPDNVPPVLAEAYRCMANLAEEMRRCTDASSQLALQQQENQELTILLAQREQELDEAYEMIAQLDAACEEINAKYKHLSAYLIKLELELRSVNRAMARQQHLRQLPASTGTTMDALLASTRKDYVLEQRGNVIYRVKRKGEQS